MTNFKPKKELIDELIYSFNADEEQKLKELAFKMIKSFPRYSLGWKVMGAALERKGKLNEAAIYMQKSIELAPLDSEAHRNLGLTYKKMGRNSDAINYLLKAIEINPRYETAYRNLGNIYKEIGKTKEALKKYQKALEINSDNIELLNDLGVLKIEMGNYEEAKIYLIRAIEIKPEISELHNNLGSVYRFQKKLNEAEHCYRKSIKINSNFAEAYNNLGVVLVDLRRLSEAKISFEQAIKIKNNYPEAYTNLGSLLKDLGCFEEAIKNYRIAINQNPDYLLAYSNLLFSMNYIENISKAERLKEALIFGERASYKISGKFHNWEGVKNNIIRIGFVSADLMSHPVGYFIEGLIKNIDRNRYDLYAYFNSPIEDEMTIKLKKNFKEWKIIYGRDDCSTARKIHKDNINVLIDLSGHTANNRLSVFCYKPSPIQISWLGYFATTGLKEIDYIIGDPYVTPEHESKQFVEQIWRLPETYLCFTPPEIELKIEELPALKNGYITFGCFNNLSKINEKVIELWSKILLNIENSKILIKAKQLNDKSTVNALLNKFNNYNVASERIIIEGFTNRIEYLNSYNRVDIALDPFPFPGGTTSVEGLWMGVPVITKKGTRFISHNGETIAINSGQSMWLAKDDQEYLDKAIYFSSDLNILSQIRNNLRRKVLSSPLMDAKRFTLNFENAIEKMWKKDSAH